MLAVTAMDVGVADGGAVAAAVDAGVGIGGRVVVGADAPLDGEGLPLQAGMPADRMIRMAVAKIWDTRNPLAGVRTGPPPQQSHPLHKPSRGQKCPGPFAGQVYATRKVPG